jgi:hypothetical protein
VEVINLDRMTKGSEITLDQSEVVYGTPEQVDVGLWLKANTSMDDIMANIGKETAGDVEILRANASISRALGGTGRKPARNGQCPFASRVIGSILHNRCRSLAARLNF